LSPAPEVTLAELDRLPTLHRETIPVEYQDEMGHMNVRWYVHLFSSAARSLFSKLGIDTAYRDRTRSGTFATRQYIEYHREVLVGDSVRIHTRLLARSEKRLHFKHWLVNETRRTVAATMETVAVHVDLDARRTVPFPAEVAASADAMVREHAAHAWDPAPCGILRA
jgi:acyl-CoA thioester hydrolase